MRLSILSSGAFLIVSMISTTITSIISEFWWIPGMVGGGLYLWLFIRKRNPNETSPWFEVGQDIGDVLDEQDVHYNHILVDEDNPNMIRFLIQCPTNGGANFETEVLSLLSAFRMRLGNAKIELKPDYDNRAMVLLLPRPEGQRKKVNLEDALEAVKKAKAKLPVSLGLTNGGKYPVLDLAEMPHLLIAGTTGSGKSVFLLNVLVSWLRFRKPQLILISPKPTTFAAFKSVATVISDANEAVQALQAMVIEMHRRYTVPGLHPPIVIMIDELAQLMVASEKPLRSATELCLVQLAQMAREASIHLVLATQRPSSEVITGLIRDNIPGRICLRVATPSASRMILGDQHGDGYKLRGNGHGYYLQGEKLLEFQAPMVSEEDVNKAIATPPTITSIRSRSYTQAA